jgi:hypothetical protein
LSNANFDTPKIQNTFIDNKIKVGIYIMPGNKNEGMLESLCLQIVEHEKEYKCIEEFFNCIPEKPKNIAKAKVQAFLSTRKNFVHSLGLAAKKGYWDFEHANLRELKKFIKNFQ